MIVGDFRRIPLPDHCADIIIFDPPYCSHGPNGRQSFARDMGAFKNKADLVEHLYCGFREISRIMKLDGICFFKWGMGNLALTPDKIRPLLPKALDWEIIIERKSFGHSKVNKFEINRVRNATYWLQIWKTV